MIEKIRFRLASLCVLLLACVGVLAVLGWLAQTGSDLRRQMSVETERAIRVTELRATIVGLNGQLAMAARLAVLSGDTRWAEHYGELSASLDRAVAEAVELATPQARNALRDTTDEASLDLARMERAAMALGATGDRPHALALLDGPEFEYLQASAEAGMQAFGQDLRVLAADRSASLRERAWTDRLGLLVGIVLMCAAAVAVAAASRVRLAAARAEAARRTDPLTGLPNRRQLKEQLRERLAREPGKVALLLLDLERFQRVNDLHGYQTGDVLLGLVASRLRLVVGKGCSPARLGGDEFAMILRVAGPAHAAAAVHRVLAAMQAPFELQDGTVLSVASRAGAALARADEGADAVLGHADIALRHAKAERRTSSIYHPGMDLAIKRRATLEAELRDAVAGDEIVPHVQPLIDLCSGSIIGFEVLARWTRAMGETISPVEFIPIIEELGLIGVMSQNLLARVCRAAVDWPPDLLVAFNVSPLQLRDRSLPATIRTLLSEAGLPPRRLEIEITESALLGDFDVARDVLEDLKACGIRLALDDFGTGYSSLLHLQKLPFDTIKIDASFVGRMVDNEESRKIVGAITGLARTLGRTTVAEGVEDVATAEMLRAMGCEVGQGWLFGRPIPAAEAMLLVGCQTVEA